MKRILFIFACLVSAPCIAADFEEFGMSSMQPLTNAEASEVRGAGVDTFVSSLATQSFNFALADRDSGSVFNMNSNAQMRAAVLPVTTMALAVPAAAVPAVLAAAVGSCVSISAFPM